MTVQAGVAGLHSVPGTELIALSVPLDSEHPIVQCSGPLNQSKLVPMPSGGERFFNCHFFPGKFTRILGIPSHLLADKEVSLETYINLGPLAEMIAEAPDFRARVSIMQKTVSLWAARTKERRAMQISDSFISLAMENNGDIRISELEQQLGYSSRYLQKIILEQVGLTPKTALENIRFQNALHMMLAHPAYPLSLIAQQSGFYDQAHFTKVFKKMMDQTPAEFIRQYTLQFYPGK
jgi:AraC-like DNA-binding protein